MSEKSNTNSVKRLWLLLTIGVIALLLPGAALAQSAADGFTPNVNGLVRAIAVQSDGKIVVGGLFSSVNGQARSNLARLNVDGSLDTTFSSGTNGTVFALCIQSGKIVIGGSFATLAGQARSNLGRLNSDGSLDATFNQGANAAVYALKLQADYQVVVGGNFTTLGGLPHNHAGRISNGGALDNSFNPSVSGAIYGLELQNDGRIVIGGSFTTVNNQPHNNIARLNTDGNLDTSFNPNANNSVSSLAVQPDGKILVGGDFTIMNIDGRNHIARINADGSLDAGFNPNADGYVDAIVLRPDGCIFIGGAFTAVAGTSIGRLAPLTANGNIGPLLGGTNNTVHALAIQWDGKLLVGGQFTTVSGSHLARYNMDNLVDSNFTGGVGGGGVYALATQPDGKLLVGGSFTSMAGLPIPYIARLNQNGSFDVGFDASANGPVYAIAVQSDGKILVGGDFSVFNGQTVHRLARLLPTGIVDNVSSFNAAADDLINGIVVQPDGKILVSGFFLNIDGQFQPGLARLNANGSFDTSFNPFFDNGITAVALQPDGKILAGGLFTSVNGQARSHLARLNPNGSLDAGFNPGANDNVYAIAIQSDGKILLGGDFSVLGGQSRNLLGRLNANGALDASFNANVDSLLGTSYVTTLTVQTDGKILVGGNLFIIAGQIVDNLVRLNANGVLDAGFASGANDTVNAVLLQSDGKIVVSGYFTALGGQPRSGFGRLTNTGPAIQYLSTISANTSLLWGRNGTGPEIKRATFESSTDGVNYNFIGEGTRTILNSWNFNNLSLPTDQIVYIRARGFYAAGSANGSGSIVESVLQTYIPSVTPCTFSLNQSSQNFTAAGSSGSVALTASSSICAWTVQSNAAWITPAVFSGSGSTSIGYVVAANPGAQRSGTMTIGGQTFTVTQDAIGCSYTVTPQTPNVAASAGGTNVTITTTAVCAWTATSNAAWMVLNASSGTGSSIVGLTIAANPNAAPRIGTLTVAGQTVTVTQDGATQFTNLQFYPLAHPVRLLDTRAGFTGCDSPGAKITGGTSRTQTAAGRTCDGLTIPANAAALVGNATSVQSGGGSFTLYPSDIAKPNSANSNFAANQILNSLFTVRLGANDGAFKIFVSTDTDIVVDITGYYAPPSGTGLYFHPLPKPVRLLDTRAGASACYTPGLPLQGNTDRTQLGTTTCDNVLIPAGAQALTGNATTVSPQANGFLTLYPADAARPLIASANFQPGVNLNSPFMVGLSPSGEFNIYVASTTDLVVDVTGYYSTQLNDANGQGLLFNALSGPVRLLDTRAGQIGCYTPGTPMVGGSPYSQPATGACTNVPATAQAVVGNATTVNAAANGYLTFWPSDANQPFIATSNYRTGITFNRHFTTGLGADGAFKRYAASTTDLVVDLVGYFAP